MNAAYVYLQLYRLFDTATPIPVDCGELCSRACCRGDESGMYLFPAEDEVYKLLNPDWITTEESDFTYKHNGKVYKTPIAMCDGNCDRYQRPLACRIFPLTPHLTESGGLEIIIDPRAKKLCPLAKGFHLEDFNEKFVRNVRKTFALLMKNKRFADFMSEYSAYIDEFGRFF